MEDALLLARTQFGLNIGFHILFPTLTIALAWFLVAFLWKYRSTGEEAWLTTYKRWVKVFALTFAMGVVTGITMSFQFGTNWPGYMNHVGAIAGPLLSYEIFTAFFLEATFLGIMLFGMNRVSPGVHLFSALAVAVGTTLSAFWILALNSWMQTPTGHVMEGRQWIAADWWSVIFNPSFPYRLVHMLLASGITASFAIAGLSAWRLLHASSDSGAARTLRAGIVTAAILVPIQVWVGELPYAGSLILTHSMDGEVKGINAFAPDVPPVTPVFFAFRIMVGMGVLMLLVSWYSTWRTRRGQAPPRWLLWVLSAFTFSGWIATLAGWIVTEIGRQPWLVTGVLRTRDAVGEVGEAALGASLTGYVLTYLALLIAYFVVLTHLAGSGDAKGVA
jgi:cytochrome d ubiquinol oxidase subunit I